MKKVLVFGTGGAANKFAEKASGAYQITGFVDNNPDKQGGLFHGQRIYSPSDIHNLAWDKIIIASMWYADIREQLIDEHGIAITEIQGVPKIFASDGKRYRPFEDSATREYAAEVLQHITAYLEERNIPCYIDHGTLLGLVRDHGLMPWDDDIDLSIAVADREQLYACCGDLVASMPGPKHLRWTTELIYNSIDEVVAVFFTLEDETETLNVFNAGLSFFTFENDLAVEAINWAPEFHYAGGEWIDTPLGRFRAPNRYEDYLKLHYGDWQTPIKDMSFGEISNFKTREAPAHWLEWDPVCDEKPTALIETRRLAPLDIGTIYIMGTCENFASGAGRKTVDVGRLEVNLTRIAEDLHAEIAVVCGLAPANEALLITILHVLIRTNIAERIHVEMDAAAQPSAAVIELMGAMGMERSFHSQIMREKGDPPIFGENCCTEAMRAAIRQFRCPYKKRVLLWEDWLAHCPMALTQFLNGDEKVLSADIVSIARNNPNLKNMILGMLRNRPCSANRTCESADSVWAPYALYEFNRSLATNKKKGASYD